MPIYHRSLLTLEYKDLISEKFDFLVDFFDFEPGDIFVEILPLEDFEKYCKVENISISNWCVGVAPKNGKVFVLDKKDFEKRRHKKEEFERVILHELAHMFIRRILWPNQTHIWIQEGICEYLSFGDYPLKIKKFVDFKNLEKKEDWDKHHSYQQSALFFKFLIKKFGENKISKFIKKIREKSEEESFKEVFGEELNKIEEEFKASLENEKITSSGNAL